MISEPTLHIRLGARIGRMPVGHASVNQFRGGPEVLLNWLETQLGLLQQPAHNANRITEYAAALEGASDPAFAQSLATDRWATAADLLARRDELRMAGWDEKDSESLPFLVRALARVSTARSMVFPDLSVRIRSVIQAISDGQKLPSHRCVMYDHVDVWPALWRQVLQRITISDPPPSTPSASPPSSLHSAQLIVLGGEPVTITQDTSFRYLAARSQTAACEFVAAALARHAQSLPDTLIYCEDDCIALQLDACLHRLGLPTMGASMQSTAHPVLQLLPLTLALCWDPVDPDALLDFLSLPVSPFSRGSSQKLIAALTRQPGLGSELWEAAVAELCAESNDPGGKLQTRISEWLMSPRVKRGEPIPTMIVQERCSLVARWSSGRARVMIQNGDSREVLIEALLAASGQASLLGELVLCQGSKVTQPQLSRLCEEAFGDGFRVSSFLEATGGPVRVRSLADIDTSCKHLVWLGLATADAVGCRWGADDLNRLRMCGIDLDDGGRALAAVRSAEARGLASVAESLLAVLLPTDLTQRWHPIWLAIRRMMRDKEQPIRLEDTLSDVDSFDLEPFTVETTEHTLELAHTRRAEWIVPPNLLRDRDSTSASDLQDRLACPLKWVLRYLANLQPSPIAQLPDNFQLRGTFCHGILERLFRNRDAIPTVEEATALVGTLFDERLALDAAPLARPHQVGERRRLREELANATRVLIEVLRAGGYHTVRIEADVSGEAFGKPLNGSIDCLVEHVDGHEVVIDFKYAGRNKYRQLLADGRAVQLATYAHSRSTSHPDGRPYPGIAYLVLAEAQLYTPSGSPIRCEARHTIDGPGVQSVWQQFSDAIKTAETWLMGADPIPARPLQPPSTWPSGVCLVLDSDLRPDAPQEPCRYCHYKKLCGLQELA